MQHGKSLATAPKGSSQPNDDVPLHRGERGSKSSRDLGDSLGVWGQPFNFSFPPIGGLELNRWFGGVLEGVSRLPSTRTRGSNPQTIN